MIHVVSLPHTLLTRDYEWCAYTAKVWRFIKMMRMAGSPVTLYGPDVADDDARDNAHEYVAVITDTDRQRWFGVSRWPGHAIFNHWSSQAPCWREMNHRTADEIRARWSPGDVLGIISGICQAQVADELADLRPLVAEWGVGYTGVIPGSHRVYESYAWAHHVAAMLGDDNIRYFDAVIPNCYDLDDFTPRFEQPTDPYLLFMARPIERKGIRIVAEIAQRVDIPVYVAGQQSADIPNTTYLGVLTGQRKAEVLAGATALLSPTVYLEPFGGVAVEAMMSGTPVIATDWGAYTETVQNGITGFRCRTLDDFLRAVKKAPELNRRSIACDTAAKYGLAAGSARYHNWFARLATLYGDGWYSL